MLKSILSSKSTLRGAVVVLVISGATTASAEIDLISDGMFSEGASAGVSETIPVPGAIGPWSVTWSSLDRSVVLIGSLWAGPPAGGYSVDLSTAAIGEFYAIRYAGSYELSFWVSGDQQGGLTTKYYSVSVSNPGSFFNDLSTTNNAQDGQWTNVTELVQLSGLEGGVFFDSLNSPSDPFGAVIGDVSLTYLGSIPEPSTWAMTLLGFATLAFAGYRATRKTGTFAAQRNN